MNESIILPRHIPTLLRIALEDIRKVERTADYEVDMRLWLERTGSVCSACLAGSVMLRLLDDDQEIFNSGWFIQPKLFGSNQNQLIASAYLEAGDVEYAYKSLDQIKPDTLPYAVKRPSYSVDPEGWWDAMQKMLDMLETADPTP